MEDDRLVQLALSRGYVTQQQLDRAKAEQKALADRGVDHGLYFLLQDMGFLSEGDARDLRRSVSSSAIRALEIDGFVIQGRLGSGGMGDVFKAVHPDGRVAAVKLLSGKLARTEEYVRRFLREARAMQRLQHPHIVGVLDSGESLGTRYILMEMVDGPSLKTWLIDKGRFDPVHAVVLLRQMTQALGYAWDHGVLHRDVKPANILLGPPRAGMSEPFCAKLCDFGLARLGADAGEPDLSRGGLTGSGLALGTPHYMSPEQASGEHDVDQRADIYGMGATVYHALLGQTLYSGKSSAVIMYKQVTESVDLQQLRSAGIDERLVSLLGRMLEKRRSARIATWAEIQAQLDAMSPADAAVQTAPVAPAAAVVPTDTATPPAVRPPVPAPPAVTRSTWRMTALIALAVTLLGAATAGLALAGGSPPAVGPAGLADALARIAAESSSVRDVVLLPGTYPGPIRIGAAHRGIRLRSAGAGVEIVGRDGSPALVCDPGLLDALVVGVALRAGAGAAAVETIGGCDLRIEDARIHGGLSIGGGVVVVQRSPIHGAVFVRDRGALELRDLVVDGPIEAERSDLRLIAADVRGQITVRAGSATLDGVRIRATVAPALLVERSRLGITDAVLDAPGVGLDARASEAAQLVGLTVQGPGPSVAWDGERRAEWRWERFSLAGPVRGQLGAVPAGPGADPARVPAGSP